MNNNLLPIHAIYTCILTPRWKEVWVVSTFGLLWGVQMLRYQLRLKSRSAVTWRESLGMFLRHRDCNPNQLVFAVPIAMPNGSLIGKNDMASPFRWKSTQRKTTKAFLDWRHSSVVELPPSIHKALVQSLYNQSAFLSYSYYVHPSSWLVCQGVGLTCTFSYVGMLP